MQGITIKNKNELFTVAFNDINAHYKHSVERKEGNNQSLEYILNNSMCKVQKQADSSRVWDQNSSYTWGVSDSERDMKEPLGAGSDLWHLRVHVPIFILYLNKSLFKNFFMRLRNFNPRKWRKPLLQVLTDWYANFQTHKKHVLKGSRIFSWTSHFLERKWLGFQDPKAYIFWNLIPSLLVIQQIILTSLTNIFFFPS